MTLIEQIEEISRRMLGPTVATWYTTPQRVDALCKKMFLHPEDALNIWVGAVRRAGRLLESPGWINEDEPAVTADDVWP